MVDYTKMDGPELLHAMGDKAANWAEAFCQKFPGHDEDLMLTWFANAIEHSTDIRRGVIHNGEHMQWLIDNNLTPKA